MSSCALAENVTLAGAPDALDTARADYLVDVRSIDPAAGMTAPPAPWDGLFEPTAAVRRFELAHRIEEFAHDAEHADIIREQVDGADAAGLLMADEGRPGNDVVQPPKPPAP